MLNLGGVDHIGVAVTSIDEQRTYYEETLGMRMEGMEVLPQHGLRVAFFVPRDHATGVRIELLELISPESTIARHLQRQVRASIASPTPSANSTRHWTHSERPASN